MNQQERIAGDVQYLPVGFSNASANPLNMYGGSIVMLTNPENELYKMELTLRGMVLDGDGNAVQKGEPLLNDRGVASVLGQAQGIVNQVTIMSNLTEREIKETVMMTFSDTIIIDLMVNRINYDIKGKSTRFRIWSIVVLGSFICLKRSWDGDDKRFWKGSQQDITMRHEGGDEKKGFLGKVFGWGSK
jgi:hypothetical protein